VELVNTRVTRMKPWSMGRFRSRIRDVHRGDLIFQWILRISGICILVLLGAILWQVGDLSSAAFQHFGWKFFWTNEWNPVQEKFGAAAFAFGTVVSSILAILISLPLSVFTALFLVEIAPRRLSKALGFLVEMLAAIPSVVYGLWGVFVLAPIMREYVQPFLQKYFGFLPFFQGPAFGLGMLTAGVILSIMITPTVCSISREVFRAIPTQLKEGALALGATRWEMMNTAILKTSHSGILGATILGLGRAMGETMAVTMVIGNRHEISASLFAPSQTMASAIANEYSEATSDLHLSALAYVGIALFVVSFITNLIARGLVWHAQSRIGVRNP